VWLDAKKIARKSPLFNLHLMARREAGAASSGLACCLHFHSSTALLADQQERTNGCIWMAHSSCATKVHKQHTFEGLVATWIGGAMLFRRYFTPKAFELHINFIF
jgi:hypothetical protein